MTTKALTRLAVAPLIALTLAACSTNTGSGSGATPAPSVSTPAATASTPADTGTTAAGTATAGGAACSALADVKASASTLKSDLQARKLAAVTADIGNLQTSFTTLLTALSSGAQAGAAELKSAWDNVKNTFQGLSKSDIGQVQSKMQGPVDELKSALDSATSGLHCI